MEYPKLEAGAAVPEFELQNQDGKTFRSSDLKGKKTILYFFPAAGSPGCTKEAADFQDQIEQFTKAGYQILGISPDSVATLKNFQESHELSFDLLSDSGLEVHKKFGAYGEKSVFGKTYRGVLRSTFLVDENQKIIDAFHNVKATGHTNFLLRRIEN